jgi:hypothetical protein
MTLELIAVQGMSVIIDQNTVVPPTPPPPPPPPVIPSGVIASIVVLPPTETKNRGENKLYHRDEDQIQVSNITVPAVNATIADTTVYTKKLLATALFDHADDDKLVLREGDHSEVINATPKIPGSPPTPYPVAFQCIIDDPNQTTNRGQ